MARVLGPQRLGYFNFIMWLTNVSGLIGSIGVPLTARKYMAEYLGRGEGGIARSVFFATLRVQAATAAVITATGMILVFTVSDPAYRYISAFQMASVLPAMMVGIPSQANMAAENLMANVLGGVVGQGIYIVSVILSLVFGWNLQGIAIGIFVYRSTEVVIRMIPVLRWMKSLPEVPLPSALRRKMWSFSGQGTILVLLNVVVWDRSDIVFLKWLSRDITQISFFSAAFGLTEKVLLLPQTFNSALGASLMAQYGRDSGRLPSMVITAVRYILLFAFPMLLGMAVLSPSIIPIIYGHQYLPAIPVLAVAAVLAIPKSMIQPAQQALQATENQGFLVWWGCICGAVNVALDLLLIPHFAAVGAAWANGLAQTAAAIGIWIRAWQVLRFRPDVGGIVKIVASSLVMAGLVWVISTPLGPWAGAAVGVPAGAAILFLCFRLTGALSSDDRKRLVYFEKMLPAFTRSAYARFLDFVAPASATREAAS